ncbi:MULTISPECIES: MotE family protein [Falsihalocynthiibacter]|uniref:Magnesium transporter MgtE intracellular domain-containing protein n=2 Tax=Falsihalocynthiibacter TaxID=2854182 RepID=A0A126UYH3_9RHOB|nr:hypothetical protein [Falsihalocynthiibacter arcticus]AML51111.1 hypothetical protein RC74_07370 [Falsihalocynthiibacter arcticus]
MTASKRSTPKKRKARQGRYALFIVSALFVMSGVLRLGGGTGIAIAKEIEALRANESDGESALCEPSAGIANLLSDLSSREERVMNRELALENRMVALELAEKKYSESLAELIEAELALDATIVRADSASESDLGQLTAMYENMKSKDAAALFEEMDPNFSSGFLVRMKPDAAADILAGLKPETAYAISVILAGRNANVPREGL